MTPGAKEDLLGYVLLARRLAREAGDLIQSQRQGVSISSKSGSSDLVTCADHASQRLIFGGISAMYPGHRLIGEEDAEHYGRLDERATWIVDAIDGTTNYVHGLRDYAVSIAFAERKEVLVGVVYNPVSGEMFCGIKGRGAYLNDVPISVSSASGLSDALVISEWGYERGDRAKKMLAVNERLLVQGVRGIRQLGSGSLDLCYVATGRAEAVYCGVVETDAWKIWDYAAAYIICTEAGAQFRTVTGQPFTIESTSMLCATPSLIHPLLTTIKQS